MQRRTELCEVADAADGAVLVSDEPSVLLQSKDSGVSDDRLVENLRRRESAIVRARRDSWSGRKCQWPGTTDRSKGSIRTHLEEVDPAKDCEDVEIGPANDPS